MSTLTTHSKIGASSMHRWSKCPGSVKLSENIPSKSSSYAEEGTIAHEYAAAALLGNVDKVPANVTEEMVDAVSVYVEEINAARFNQSTHAMLVEHKFDLSKIHEGLYGTADCVIYYPIEKLLRVYDFKYGAGISVDVENNEQLMYYGLGALLSMGVLCDEVELVIVQPRCPHPDGQIRKWKFSSFELIEFAADLKEAALATEKEDAPLVPGDHCRFCPAAGVCPAINEKAIALAKEEFSQIISYDPEKLANTLNWLPALEGWIKNVREFAYQEAEHGRNPPGWKLVQKRATRKWQDEDVIEELCLKLGREDLFTKKIKSVAQVEKIIGKKDFKKAMEAFVISESSGFTLAPESDKREAFGRDPTSEFTVIEQ